MKLKNAVVACALALSGVSIAPVAANAQETHLSQCMRNGLIGAGAGAVIGALTSHHHQARSAVVGAAVGGIGTWGICRLLSHNDERRVERAYQRSLTRNHSVSDEWGSKSLYVERPRYAGEGCRRVTATITDGDHGRQDLPPETFCRTSDGRWIPAES